MDGLLTCLVGLCCHRPAWFSRCSGFLTKRADIDRGLPRATIGAASKHSRLQWEIENTGRKQKRPCLAFAMTEPVNYERTPMRNRGGIKACHGAIAIVQTLGRPFATNAAAR